MELGQKLRQARMEAGLSQRQLCGEEITRNMLSQIENGSARPSMDTLRFLAAGLGKPVSWFLEEDALLSPNQTAMAAAREAFSHGDHAGAVKALADYQSPDPVFDAERGLLEAKCALALAEQAIAQEQLPYAAELLEKSEKWGKSTPYYGPELENHRLLLLSEAGQAVTLPSHDRWLLAQAESAPTPERAGHYLDAASDRGPRWQLLRGRAYLAQKAWASAKSCFEAAEEAYPKEATAALEHCCRELEDFKGAYHYACKLRDLG